MRTFYLGIVIVIVLCFACVFDYSDYVESTQLNTKSKLIPSLLNHLKFSNMENDLDSSCDDVTNTVDDYDFYINLHARKMISGISQLSPTIVSVYKI